MDDRVIKKLVPDPQNPEKKIPGTVVKISNSEEPFSYVYLADGTTITAKMSFLEVVRIDNKWNADGQPIYNIIQSGAIIVSAPENLLKTDK